MYGAIGEAIEHYCAHHPVVSGERFTSEELPGPSITPEECVLYSDRQYANEAFPYRQWDSSEKISWVPGLEFPGGYKAPAEGTGRHPRPTVAAGLQVL